MSQYTTSSNNITSSRPSSRRHGALTAKMHARHYVQHVYQDYAKTTVDMVAVPRKGRRGGVITPFPLKLHQVLEQVETDGYAHVISWQPHGRCFMIHKPKDFVARVMPKYFNQTKLTSFQRQLNLYGFQRLTKGPDTSGYYHQCFLRGKPFLTAKMVRTRVKGTKVKGASNPEQEPDFYAMPPLNATPSPIVTSDEDEEATVSSHSTLQNDATLSTNYHAQELPQLLPSIHKEEIASSSHIYTSLPKRDPSSSVGNDSFSSSVGPLVLPELSGAHPTMLDVMTSFNPIANTSDHVTKIEYEENSDFDHNLAQPFHDNPMNDPVDAMILEFRQENNSMDKGDSTTSYDDATLGHFLDLMMNDPIFDC